MLLIQALVTPRGSTQTGQLLNACSRNVSASAQKPNVQGVQDRHFLGQILGSSLLQCAYVCTRSGGHIYNIDIYIYACICIYIYINRYRCRYIYIYTRVHIYIYTLIHLQQSSFCMRVRPPKCLCRVGMSDCQLPRGSHSDCAASSPAQTEAAGRTFAAMGPSCMIGQREWQFTQVANFA